MGTCPTNTDGSLTPFVAKYCTALGYDMDMMRTLSAQELICAMSEKLNKCVETINNLMGCYNSLVSLYGNVAVSDAGGLTVGEAYRIPGAFVVPEITGTLPLGATAVKFEGSFELRGSILMSEVLTDGTASEAFANYGLVCETVDGVPTISVSAQTGTGTFRIPPQLVPIKEA